MKNKKGFTLVELLAVIAIMAVLMLVAVPSYIAISGNIKEKMRSSKIATIESAAELWAQDHKNNCKTDLTIQELIDGGYLKADDKSGKIYNPKTGEEVNGKLNSLGINMDKICRNAKGEKKEIASSEYLSKINEELKSNSIKYDDISANLSNTFRPSLSDAYNACKLNGSIKGCDLLSSSNFNATDSDYEDYRVSNNNGNLHVYRALYKYNITINVEDIYGDKTKVKEIELKVDDDNAEDALNGVPSYPGYELSTDCFGLYEQEGEYLINTSGTHDKNIVCSIDFVPKEHKLWFASSYGRISGYTPYQTGWYEISTRHGDEFELNVVPDAGYQITDAWCNTAAVDIEGNMLIISNVSDSGDCMIEYGK